MFPWPLDEQIKINIYIIVLICSGGCFVLINERRASRRRRLRRSKRPPKKKDTFGKWLSDVAHRSRDLPSMGAFRPAEFIGGNKKARNGRLRLRISKEHLQVSHKMAPRHRPELSRPPMGAFRQRRFSCDNERVCCFDIKGPNQLVKSANLT